MNGGGGDCGCGAMRMRRMACGGSVGTQRSGVCWCIKEWCRLRKRRMRMRMRRVVFLLLLLLLLCVLNDGVCVFYHFLWKV